MNHRVLLRTLGFASALALAVVASPGLQRETLAASGQESSASGVGAPTSSAPNTTHGASAVIDTSTSTKGEQTAKKKPFEVFHDQDRPGSEIGCKAWETEINRTYGDKMQASNEGRGFDAMAEGAMLETMISSALDAGCIVLEH